MIGMQGFHAKCVVSPSDFIECCSGKLGVEFGTFHGTPVLLSRADAIRLANWILAVCEAESVEMDRPTFDHEAEPGKE